jgi:hypothetical protein
VAVIEEKMARWFWDTRGRSKKPVVQHKLGENAPCNRIDPDYFLHDQQHAPQMRIGIPKGSLQETTRKLFDLAGYDLRISGRSYYPGIDDLVLQCILIRPQEMARYVEQGVLDCAITGLDWILETGADVAELADLKAPRPMTGRRARSNAC